MTSLVGFWPGYPAGADSPPSNTQPPKPHGIPWAHIHAGGWYAYCESQVPILSSSDFFFTDARYALKYYGPENKVLQACSKCLKAVRKELNGLE